MTFNDIFKSSFLENVSSIRIFDMLLTIVLSFGIGLFIFLVYKKTYRGVMYSAGFGTTLVALTMITSIVILAVTSNVCSSVSRYGRCALYCSFPYCHQRSSGYCLFVLGDRCRYYPCSRHDPSGNHRQRLHRSDFAGICQSEILYPSLHGRAKLRKS